MSKEAAQQQQAALYASERDLRAEWDAAYVNDLPDSAFACIDAGGEKDEQGKTVPRSLRHYPHHNAAGELDMPHLNAAWSRVNQDATTSCGKDHLAAHRKSEGMGDRALSNERRFAIDSWQTADFQIRADGDGMTFHGYAAVFNTDSEPLPRWGVERIAPGAFAKSLSEQRNLRMFLNHNPDLVLASTRSGTLRLAEDEIGLRVEADLPDTQVGHDLSVLVQRGDVDSMSFGFAPVPGKYRAREDGIKGTIHSEVRLFEVSPVTSWPAYQATSAFVRSLAALSHTEPEPLAEALRLLVDPDGTLSAEQRDLLLVTINARTDVPLIGPQLSRWQHRLAELPA